MIDGAREPFYQLSTITVEAAEITIKELPIHATSTTSAITVASMSSPLDMPLRSMLAEADIEGKRKGQDDGGDGADGSGGKGTGEDYGTRLTSMDFPIPLCACLVPQLLLQVAEPAMQPSLQAGLAASIFEEDDTGADTGMPVDMETPCAKRSAASLFENSDSDAHDDADAQIGDGECELEIEGQEIMHGIEERRVQSWFALAWYRLHNVSLACSELSMSGAVVMRPLAQLLGESRFCVHEGSDPQCSGSIPTQGQDLDQVNESYSLVGDPSADSQATRPGVRECELPASARTPVHLPVSSKEVEVYPCKLFLTQQRFSMLLTRKGAGQPAAKAQATEIIEDPSESTSKSSKFKTENAQEAPNTLQIEAHLTSPLQVLHTNSAANIASALQKNMHSEVVDQARSFDRVLHVVTTDDYAANHLAEKMLTQQEMCELHGDVSEDDPARSDDKAGKLHLICEVHRLHGVAASMYSLCPDFISGLIKASLVLRSGHMSSLRRCLRALIVAKLRVYQCEPPENVVAGPSIPASKAFFMNTFFSNLASADALLLQELFNGDWGETMQRFLREGVRLLAGAAPSIFPRHKWIGSDAAIDWYGRLQCVHGLLTQVFEDVFGPSPGPSRPNKPTASDPAQSQSSHAQAQSRAQTRPSDAMDTDDVEAQAQDDRGQLLALQVFETCGFAAADSGDRQDDQWKAIAKKWRDAAYAWACGHPDGPLALLAEMVFLRTVLGPQVNLMAKQLKLSSSEFDQQQALAELTTGLRKYRLTEVHADSASAEAEVALAKLFQKSHWESLPFVFLTQRNNSFAFKLTARVLAALKVYIRNRRSGYPYKLFLLATAQATEAERVAKEIVFDFFYEPCRLDSFTWWFVKGFRSAERLASAEARAHLQAIAKVASVDIAATECQHASNRRHIESKSIQSHRQLLAAASAAYVARTLRHTCAPSRGFQSSKPVPRKPGRKPRTKPDFRSVHFPRAQDLRRGGGSWNVFLSQNRGGPQVTTPAGKHSKAQLRKRYHDLKRQAGSDWQELQRLGSLKTQARKFAKKGSGPLIPRKRKATDALPPVAEHGSLLNTKHLRLQQRRLAVKQDREKQQAVRDSACRLQDSLSHADVSASEQAVLNFSGITAQELCRDADSSRPVSSCPPQLELIEPGSVSELQPSTPLGLGLGPLTSALALPAASAQVAALPVSVNQSAPAKLESISPAASMDAMAMESMEAAARAAAETTMTMAMNPASVWALRPDVANSRTGLCLDTSATAMHAAPFFLAQISQGEPSFLRGMTNFQNLDLAWHQRHEVVSTASGVAEGEQPDQPARACAEVLPSIKDDQHEQQEEDVDPQSQDRVPAAKRTKTLKVSKSKCLGFNRCLCKGEGKTLERIFCRLRNTMRGILSVHAVSKDVLKDGCLFLRFSSCSPESLRSEGQSVLAPFQSKVVWYHISLCFGGLQQLSLYGVRMHPEPEHPEGDVAGLVPRQSRQSLRAGPTCYDRYQMLLELHNFDVAWMVSVYELVEARAPIPQVDPGLVLVQVHRDLPAACFWRGSQLEHAPRRGQGGGGGGGPRGPGPGSSGPKKPKQDPSPRDPQLQITPAPKRRPQPGPKPAGKAKSKPPPTVGSIFDENDDSPNGPAETQPAEVFFQDGVDDEGGPPASVHSPAGSLSPAEDSLPNTLLPEQDKSLQVALQQSMLEQEERQGNSESEGSDDTDGKFAEFFASRARRRANAAGEDEVAAESVGSQDSDEHWGQEDADERIGASLLAEDPNLQPGTLDLPFGHSVETTAAATAMAMAARASGAEPSGSATVRDAAAESFAEALMSAMAFEDEFEAELRGGGAIGAMSESGDENRNVPTPPAPLSVHPPATPPVRDPSDELGRGHDRPASDSAVPSAPSRAPPVRGSSARTAALPAGPRLVHDGLAIRNDDGSILAWIKHKPQSNDFFVNCSLHENCTKTKTLRSSQRHGRRLQGRPLGFLAAWAVQGHACLSKEAHSLVVPSFLDRKNARARLRQEANASEFFVKERDRRSDEPDSEPDHCP
ncbi:unnamed protein product [Symbiodinium sp. CCMP2592]|nr:unnamed protein product [Symbiodinium sp. CCMP2592]